MQNNSAIVSILPRAGQPESTSPMVFDVELDAAVSGGFTVDYTLSDDTATAGLDYNGASGTLTFTGNTGEIQNINVPLLDDTVVEVDETFTLSLSNISNTDVKIGAAVTGTILKEDSATLSIADANVTEGTGDNTMLSYVLTLSNPVDVPVSVNVSSADDTATAPADYIAVAESQTIPAGNVTVTGTVTIVSDAIDEGASERFSLNIGTLIDDGRNVTIDPSQSEMTILDDDTASLNLNTTTATVSETGTTSNVDVTLNSEPTATVTIGISSSDTDEVTVSPTSLTFDNTNWNVSQSIGLTGVDDSVDDSDQIVSVIVSSNTSADTAYAALGDQTITVTNTDDDSAGINISPGTAQTLTEDPTGTPSVTFTVTLNSEPTADVTVPVSLSSNRCVFSPSNPSVVLNSSTYSNGATVTVEAVDNIVADGDAACDLMTGLASSTDTNYADLDALDVSITVQDNDAPTPDVNQDGIVSASDVVYVLNRLGQSITTESVLADQDRDGDIEADDAQAVIDLLGTTFP